MIRAACLCLALAAGSAFAQQPPRVASLDWMAGSWVLVRGEERVAETWLGPGNGLLVGVNLTTKGERKSFEFLRIADTPEGFSYYASPGGRSPATEFKLKERGERRVVFENAAHDFPQRVLYWREGDHLVARIEGTIQGRERQQEWRWTRER